MTTFLTIPALDRPHSLAAAKTFFDTKHAELRARLNEAITAAEVTIKDADTVDGDTGLLRYYTRKMRAHSDEIAALRHDIETIEALWTPTA